MVCMMAVEPTAREILERFFAQVGARLSTVLNTEVEVGPPTVDGGWPALEDAYVATLAMEHPRPMELYLALARPCAQACGGLLVMMQEKVIQDKIASGDVDEDDLESIGEATSQLTSVLDEVIAAVAQVDSHVVFADGEMVAEAREGDWVHAVVTLKVGALCEGTMACVLPARAIAPQAEPEAEGGAEAGTGAGVGVELSPEEMAAIREATREGALQGAGSLGVWLPVARGRDEWTSLCQAAGLTPEFARDLYQVRRLCRAGQIRAVVVDGDVAPGGGVPAVLHLRRWAEVAVPVLVAASRPTRRHVVACLAAGAATYLVKPVAPEVLAERVDEVTAAWEQLAQPA